MVSGGFDPVHVGHIRMFEEAAEYGRLIVVLNSDRWLRQKKGFCFFPWRERAEIIKAMKFVDEVVSVDDRNGTVSQALIKHNPTYFANGGDRNPNTTPTPEMQVCNDLGIELLWGLGGIKFTGSTPAFEKALVEAYGEGFKELFGDALK